MPVARTRVGNSSDSAAGATPVKMATNTQNALWTVRSAASVCTSLSQRSSG